MKRKEKLIFFIFFFIVFVFLFFISLNWQSFEWDEGVSYASSLAIFNGENKLTADVIPQYLFSLFLLIGDSFLIAPIINSLVLFISCLVLFSIIMILTKKQIISYLCVLLYLSYPFVIDLISWRPYHIFILFYLFSILFFIKFIIHNRLKDLILISVFLSLSFYSKNLSIIFIIPILIFLVYVSIKRKEFFKLIKYCIIPLIIFLSPIIIIRLFIVDFNFLDALFVTDFNNLWIVKYSEIYSHHINNIFDQRQGTILQFIYAGFGIVPMILLILYNFFRVSYKSRLEKLLFGINFLIFILFILFLYRGSPFHQRYLMLIIIPIIIEFGIALKNLFNQTKSSHIIYLIVSILSILSILSIISIIGETLNPEGDYIKDMGQINNIIRNPEDKIIGSTPALQFYIRNRIINPTRDLTEEEAKIYYSWNLIELNKIFEEQNINWIILRKSRYWEVTAILWIEEAFDIHLNHYDSLRDLEQNYLIYDGEVLSLYKITKNETTN